MFNPANSHSSCSEGNNGISWINSGLYDFPKNESNSFQPLKDQVSNSSYNKHNQNPVQLSEDMKKDMYFMNSPGMQRKKHISHSYCHSNTGKPVVSVTDLKPSMQVQGMYEPEFQKRNMEFSQNDPYLIRAYPREMSKFPFNSFDGNSIKTKGLLQHENILQEKCFLINLYVETKDSHMGPFSFEIHPKTNLRLLKLQVEKELDIPAAYQNWILNQTLDINCDVPLVNYGVIPKSSIFLYVDSSYKKPINVRRISELPQMKNSAPSKKVFTSGPYQNSYHFVTKNVNNIAENNLAGLKTADYQESYVDLSEPQASQMRKMTTSFFQPERIGGSLKFNPTETDCKVPSSNLTPKSLRKILKKGTFINTKRRDSNPSDKESKNVDKFIKNDRRDRISSIEGSNIETPFLSEPVKATAKDDNSLIKIDYKHPPLLPTDLVETVGSILSANSSELASSHFPGDSIHVENQISESVSKRKDSKSSILKQIKDINKTKQQTKALAFHEKELSSETEKALNEHVPLMDLSSNPPIQMFPAISMDDSHIIRTLSNHSEKVMEAKPSNYLLTETFVNTEKSVISNLDKLAVDKLVAEEPLSITYDEKSINNEVVPGKFVEESHSIEVSDKVVTENSNSTSECIITNINNEIALVHSNEVPNFEKRIETQESPLEIYIECTISNEDANELNRVNTEEAQDKHTEVNKESAENYDFLLRMENLNLVKNVINFTCPICFGEFESDQGVVLHECLHTFCMECLARAVNYAEEALIKCPYRDDDYSCQSYLQQREIKSLVSAEVYDRYLQKSITTAESLAEKSFHCKTPDCPGWCMFEDNLNVFHCPVCFHFNCLNCQAMHEGLNCRQYQDKLKNEVKLDRDSEKTLEFLNKMIEGGKAMKCPKCDLIVMKKWGCDWLKCCICKTEICWITKGPRWGPAGQGDTSAGCRCGVNGKKCHPSCTYCH